MVLLLALRTCRLSEIPKIRGKAMHTKQKTKSKTTVFIYDSPRGPFTFAASPQLRMLHIAFYPYPNRFRNRFYLNYFFYSTSFLIYDFDLEGLVYKDWGICLAAISDSPKYIYVQLRRGK